MAKERKIPLVRKKNASELHKDLVKHWDTKESKNYSISDLKALNEMKPKKKK
jgi:hypothetical protein